MNKYAFTADMLPSTIAETEHLFELMKEVADYFGWELSVRDPGPVHCDLEAGWCHTHQAWIDEHDWRMAPDHPTRFRVLP